MENRVSVVIPAFNEENAIGQVLGDLPWDLLSQVVVVDNNSSDKTQEEAQKGGAIVLKEHFQGYGASCLKGINYLLEQELPPDIIVFLDADYSDHPNELPALLAPILQDKFDLVIGSRALGNREKGSMTFPQVFGNWLATSLIRFIYGVRYTDLGPFRAVKTSSLVKLGMCDLTYGWTVEMQVKAAKLGMLVKDVPVSYRQRIGVSKISGTIKGTLLAGYKIITTIFKYR
ncbi:MAG: glycosyltransferase family 2 protein [Flavobacteriales bacterium]|nr:glycosyltransferase family 2 protein [Flavobacteriales bacterium]